MVRFALMLMPVAVEVFAQDASSSCDIVARVLAELPTLAIDRSDGQVRDYRTGEVGRGCRVEVKGLATAYRDRDAPDVVLREQLTRLGWTEDYQHAADGPDGSAFAFRSGSTLCVFQAHWDGGDDSDPSYVPDDRYDIEVDCLFRASGPR